MSYLADFNYIQPGFWMHKRIAVVVRKDTANSSGNVTFRQYSPSESDLIYPSDYNAKGFRTLEDACYYIETR
jgi:hypothetical protein